MFDSLQVTRPLRLALLRPFFDPKRTAFCKHISPLPYIINLLPHPPPKPVKYVTLSPCPPVTLSSLTLLPCLPLPCPQATCSLVYLSTRQPVNLFTRQPVNSSTYPQNLRYSCIILISLHNH